MLEFLTELANDAIGLARTVAMLIAVGSVVLVWISTRALVPVLAAILMAAIALFAISPAGLGWLQDRVAEDAERIVESAPAGPRDRPAAVRSAGPPGRGAT